MEKKLLIGRKEESDILYECLYSGNSELIAVYGRRRIGKTYLVRTLYSDRICFEITGVHNASLKTQLANFSEALSIAMKLKKIAESPSNWLQAFQSLKKYIERIKKTKNKKVIFFDELPWLDSRRSGFLGAFEHFWNSWASKRTDIIVVICGSAASWMISKIVNNKGGLHNRITKKIRLLPFTLHEMELYLQSRRVQLDKYQLLQLYMAMGGIPHYLKEIKPGQSAVQNIERICFTKDGLLNTEFRNLYSALYEHSEKHIAIIKALASKRTGLTRNEIIGISGLTTGGTITTVLEELNESGFISSYDPLIKKTKDTLYRLTDEYSLFYIKFIEGTKNTVKNAWVQRSGSASYKSWSGYAFESVCIKHALQVKKALGIEGVYTEETSWRYSDKKNGAQIDLVIDRRDRCINICEIKFSENIFEINKSYAAELTNKLNVFRSATRTNKTLFLTMITTFGVKENIYKTSMVSNSVQIEKLFE